MIENEHFRFTSFRIIIIIESSIKVEEAQWKKIK